jgi:formiminotetrahydrofolate cyclodeaminase
VPTIEILRTPEIYQRVMKNMDMPEPKEPPKDDLEVWEKYQAEIDDYPKKFRAKVEEEAEKIRKADMEELRKRTSEELYKVYENEVIAKLCQEEMNDAFYDMSIYLSTFKDEKFKNRAFKSFEDYDNVHPNFKTKLKEEYQRLELGIDLLKKLPEATE